MNALLLIAALGGGPTLADGLVQHESADVIEVNHVYDEQGRLTFVQLLPRRWESEGNSGRHRIVVWRLARHEAMRPVPTSGGWQAAALDDRGLLVLSAPSVRPTWTQYDVELLERSQRPPAFRPAAPSPSSPTEPQPADLAGR